MSVTATQDLTWEIQTGTPRIAGTEDLAWTISAFVASITGAADVAWRIGVSDVELDLILTDAPTGLTGVLSVSIVTLDGSLTIVLPTTQGIHESPTGSGRYLVTVRMPDPGRYFVVWRYGVTTVTTPLSVVRTGSLEASGSVVY